MDSMAVILPAAGRSARFGGRNKLMEMLGDRSVISRAAGAFLSRRDVVQLIIPTMDEAAIRSGLRRQDQLDPRLRLCQGGPSRAHSVQNALRLVDGDVPWVAVHDAARPLVSQQIIDATLAAAMAHGSAVPAMPVHLTIKQAMGPLPARVQKTVPRDKLWAMQTPQIMRTADLRHAFDHCPIPLEEVTDDVQLIELAGGEVWLVDGDPRNLKITTALDLRIAQLLLAEGVPKI